MAAKFLFGLCSFLAFHTIDASYSTLGTVQSTHDQMLSKELARRLEKVGPIHRLEKKSKEEQVTPDIEPHLRKSSFLQGFQSPNWMESPSVAIARLAEQQLQQDRFTNPTTRCKWVVNATYNLLKWHLSQCNNLNFTGVSSTFTLDCQVYVNAAQTGALSNLLIAMFNFMNNYQSEGVPYSQILLWSRDGPLMGFYLNNFVDLQDAIMSSYPAWTSQDWSDLAWCSGKSQMTNLEENTKVELPPAPPFSTQPLFVVQGDMIMEDTHTIYPWAGGVVNWCFDNLPENNAGTLTYVKDNFLAAIRTIQTQLNGGGSQCLTFNKLPNAVSGSCNTFPSIAVRTGRPGCWSHVGQVSGYYTNWMSRSQIVNLGDGCESTGMILHQLLHALGMPHEFARNDRQQFLRVNNTQVEGGVSGTKAPVYSLYDKYPDSAENTARFPGDIVDYLSIMMSPPTTFTGNPTWIQAINAPIEDRYMGQRLGLSELDVLHLADMYKCPSSNVMAMYATKNLNAALVQGSGFVRDGSCVDQNYTGVGYVDGSGTQHPYSCADIAKQQWCTGAKKIITTRAQMRCPYTCLQCIQAPVNLQYINTTVIAPKNKTYLPGPRYTFSIDANPANLPQTW